MKLPGCRFRRSSVRWPDTGSSNLSTTRHHAELVTFSECQDHWIDRPRPRFLPEVAHALGDALGGALVLVHDFLASVQRLV